MPELESNCGSIWKLDVTDRNPLIGDNDGDFRYKLNNEKAHAICCTSDVSNFIQKQQEDYAGRIITMPIETPINSFSSGTSAEVQ